jgi:hypothetical protein
MHMPRALSTAAMPVLLASALVACGASDLDPIEAPPLVDAGHADGPVAQDVGAPETPDSDAAIVPCKRGLAANDSPSAALAPAASSPGTVWWYNWAAQSPGGDPRIEFVPMIWGGGSVGQAIPAGSRYLLGYNEPNFNSQANLTVAQAAADWPAVETRAGTLPIVSPAVNFCGSAADTSKCTDPAITDPYTYLKDFFAACSGCRVDYVGVHAYVCDVPSLRAYLEGNTSTGGTMPGFLQFGKPIWLTEFACDSSHSVADQKAYMQAAVPYLESSPYVFRYAWFNAKNIPNAVLTNADGSLTDLGSTYVGLPAACR